MSVFARTKFFFSKVRRCKAMLESIRRLVLFSTFVADVVAFNP